MRAVITNNGDVDLGGDLRGSVLGRSRPASQRDRPDLNIPLDMCGEIEWYADQHGLHVSLDPEFVAPAALARLVNWLASASLQRVHVRLRNEAGPNDSILPSIKDARDFILKRVDGSDRLTRRQYLSRPMTARELRSAPAWMADGLNYWHAEGAWLDFCRDSELDPLRAIFEGRYFVFEATSDRGHVLRHVGEGIKLPVRKWAEPECDKPIVHAPDRHYGSALNADYTRIMSQGQPVAELVDALVTWPGMGRVRHQYWRLSLPYRAHGKQWLITGTRLDPVVNLRSR